MIEGGDPVPPKRGARSETAAPTEPVARSDTAGRSQPTRPAEPAARSDTAGRSQPTRPAEPAARSDTAGRSQPTRPAEPAVPVEMAARPTEPVARSEPARQVQSAASPNGPDPALSERSTGPGRAAEIIAAALADMGVAMAREEPDAFLVTLPGERRHRTLVWLIVGAHEVLIESFVCRKPDENIEGVYRFLLQRNAKLRTVAYALDPAGDIHLVGRLPLGSVTAAELDTVLGVVLQTSDADFNAILERGFTSAIRREWAWRTSRGYSVKNLRAFRHLVEG